MSERAEVALIGRGRESFMGQIGQRPEDAAPGVVDEDEGGHRLGCAFFHDEKRSVALIIGFRIRAVFRLHFFSA